MREEIAAAVVFLKRLIQKCESLPSGKVEEFSNCLSEVLVDRFRDHWYKEKPTKGQGYRCISFSPAEPIDPVLEKAASGSGISLQEPVLPIEMILWVDPNEVCCRIGDMRTNYCTVATMKDGSLDNKADTLDVSDLIQQARELYNRQLNITTTRVNTNTGNTSRPYEKLLSWQSIRSRPDRSYNKPLFNNNIKTSTQLKNFALIDKMSDQNIDQNENNNNKKFHNQNHQKPFNNFNSRPPFGPLDNGQPFIPPDFSIPPPPLGLKLWQAPGAYSPPAKNKKFNANISKSFNSTSVPGNLTPVKHDRFHWQKDSQKVVS